jgi:hypothetical protein
MISKFDPAFPDSDNLSLDDRGLSFRDYFAIRILPILLNNPYYTASAAVEKSYDIADKMCAEREKGNKEYLRKMGVL